MGIMAADTTYAADIEDSHPSQYAGDVASNVSTKNGGNSRWVKTSKNM
jgi:hypothetical protein